MYKKNELQEIPNTPRPLNSTGFKKKKKKKNNEIKKKHKPTNDNQKIFKSLLSSFK